MTTWLDAIPPQNLEAEQCALGAMLIESKALDAVRSILCATDFYRDAHRVIFDALCSLRDRGDPVDLLTMADALKASGRLDEIGGTLYLLHLMDAPSTAANAAHYARMVKVKAIRRKLLDELLLAQALAQSDKDDELPGDLARIHQAILEIRPFEERPAFDRIGPLVRESVERADRRRKSSQPEGIPSGFEELDFHTGGWQPGTLVLLGGRPSMGKSSLAMQFGYEAARHGHKTLMFSLEMSRAQLADRTLAVRAEVDSHHLRAGYMPAPEWQRVLEVQPLLEPWPLLICDKSDVTVAEMRGHVRAESRDGDRVRLVLVDYLQLIACAHMENRNAEMGEICAQLKRMAVEHDCTVVALAQLSRALESRPDKRPMLSDIREGGNAEGHADVVLFVYRDAYYQRKQGVQETSAALESEAAEIIVAKQRDGRTGTANVMFQPRFVRFVDTTPRTDEPTPPERPMAPTHAVVRAPVKNGHQPQKSRQTVPPASTHIAAMFDGGVEPKPDDDLDDPFQNE